MPTPRFLAAACAAACYTCLAPTSWGQSVALSGVMGNKALLVVNGSAPKLLGLNESHQGVRVVALEGNSATVQVQGQRQTLRMGASPVSIGQVMASGRKVVLRADSRGHFQENGFINNKPMRYMVDTGATGIAIGQPDAERIGLDYEKGDKVTVRTANGNAKAWRIRLNTVQVGDITIYGVDALVTPQPMPYVLLGNTFLSKVHMTRQGNEMVLEHR